MTSSIPDSMSFDDLQNLQTEAAKREAEETTQENTVLYDGKTQDELCEIAEKHVKTAIQECNDPMVHKVMLLDILNNMIEWHTRVAMEQENERSQICWLRDAGKIQAAATILHSVTCGPDDFTV